MPQKCGMCNCQNISVNLKMKLHVVAKLHRIFFLGFIISHPTYLVSDVPSHYSTSPEHQLVTSSDYRCLQHAHMNYTHMLLRLPR